MGSEGSTGTQGSLAERSAAIGVSDRLGQAIIELHGLALAQLFADGVLNFAEGRSGVWLY